jgi:hypothetical protein
MCAYHYLCYNNFNCDTIIKESIDLDPFVSENLRAKVPRWLKRRGFTTCLNNCSFQSSLNTREWKDVENNR